MNRLAFLVIALCATASWAHAALDITFEQPEYIVSPLNGQDGWTTQSASWYVVASDPIAGLQSAHVDSTNSANFSLVGQDFQDVTTVSGLMRVDPAGAFPATSGSFFLENTSAQFFLGVWANSDRNLYYLNSTSTAWINTGMSYSENDVLQLTAVLNFTSQKFDLTLTNLTTPNEISVFGAGFSSLTTTETALGNILLTGQGAAFDNISVQAIPEPKVIAFLFLVGILAVGNRCKPAFRG